MKIATGLALAAACLSTTAAAQADPPMRADSSEGLYASLRDMGFQPDPMDTSGSPSTIITSAGDRYWVILGGCNEQKRGCKTVMVGSRFTDVVNPPLDWVNKMNVAYDLLKVWITEEGELGYGVQAPATAMSRANFRALIDGLGGAAGSLGQDAKEAGLVSP